MIATAKDYAAGSAAANKLVQQDLSHVPAMIRNMIPMDQVKPFCDAMAKAVIDAVDKDRAAG